MFLSLFATIAAAVVVPLSNWINQTGILQNVTNAPRLGAIDPRFTTDYKPRQARLSATSCLFNAVSAMMELALEDFTEPILARNLEDSDYLDVVILPILIAPGHRVDGFCYWGGKGRNKVDDQSPKFP